jgi:hypothetical protein
MTTEQSRKRHIKDPNGPTMQALDFLRLPRSLKSVCPECKAAEIFVGQPNKSKLLPIYLPFVGSQKSLVHRISERDNVSAFGKKPGLSVGRSSFGVARPMTGGGPSIAQQPDYAQTTGGGEQFPPIESANLPGGSNGGPQTAMQEAMSRLSDRANNAAPVDEGPQGFEASVHKIKEQVLPRLLERVDPEAAASLNKEELTEEFRPIILEVLAELKLTLNRREQFALEKVLVDELLGFGPLEELLSDPDITDIMVNGPLQTYIEKKGKLQIAPIQFRDEEHLFQIAQRIVNRKDNCLDGLSYLMNDSRSEHRRTTHCGELRIDHDHLISLFKGLHGYATRIFGKSLSFSSQCFCSS